MMILIGGKNSAYHMDTEVDEPNQNQEIPDTRQESEGSDEKMNIPLREWIKRNKRVRENPSDEDDIPLDGLAKRMKTRK